MVKLVIQIPAYNEANSLPDVLHELPRAIEGIDDIVILVIDDGSDDDTAKVALQHGAHYVARLKRHVGLARAFQTGLEIALSLDADIIVNTDADMTYPAKYIPELIHPVLTGEADIVIGDRKPSRVPHFSLIKRFFHWSGNIILSKLLQEKVPDATSGFRVFSRESAEKLMIFTTYSYTIETIIFASKAKMRTVYIPIEIRPPTRPSRLQKNMFHFIFRQTLSIIRAFAFTDPLFTFVTISIPFWIIGLGLEFRFLYKYLTGQGGVARYIQSVTIGGTFLVFAFLFDLIGLLGDAFRVNRIMLEKTLHSVRKLKPKSTDLSSFSYTLLQRNDNNHDRIK